VAGIRVIIQVSQDIGVTSMPYNECFSFRSGAYPEERSHYVANYPKHVDQLKGVDHKASNVHLHERGGSDGICGVVKRLVEEYCPSNGVVVHSHDPAITPTLASALRPYRKNVQILHTVHNNYRLKPGKWRWNTHQSILRSDYTTFCGESAFASYPMRWWFRHKISAIPNGVDLERIGRAKNVCAAREPIASHDKNTPIRLVTIAKGGNQKNTGFLIRLVHSLRDDVVLKIIGHLDKDTRALLKECRPTNVETTGILGRDEVYANFLQSDLYVSSSSFEGLPMAVLEAMACGLPVILSNISAHREIMGLTSTRFEPGHESSGPILLDMDRSQWRDAIMWFVDHPSALRTAGARNETIVAARFNLQQAQERYTRIYDILLNG